MIYRRAFFTEILRTITTLLVVLGGLLTIIGLSRLLADHTALPVQATLVLVALQLLKYSPQLLTASLFAALVVVFGRMRQSGEMAAWGVAGLNVRDWQTAVLAIAVPMAATVALLALHSVPWSVRYSQAYLREVSKTIKLENATPSLFGEIPAHGLVFHLDALSPDRTEALGVFIIRAPDPASLQVMSAKRSKTVLDLGGLRRMEMNAGHVHELNFTTGQGSLIKFTDATLHLGNQAIANNPSRRARALADLDDTAPDQVEYWWRYAFFPTAVLLSLLALPLGLTRLGRGRGYQTVLALLAYWLFYACVNLFKDYGIQGKLPLLLAAFTPQLALLLPCALGGVLYWRKRRQVQ